MRRPSSRNSVSQRRKSAADAEVDAHLRIVSVSAIHVVTLFVGHHLEREFIVIAQEESPLAVFRQRRRLGQDVDDRKTVFHA